MDIKFMLRDALDRRISEYKGSKKPLESISGDMDKFNHLTGAIAALNTLKQQVESINSYTSASDFTRKVELEIRTTHQKLRLFSFHSSVTYQDAKSGIIEALGLVIEYLPRLEEHWLDRE